MTPQLIRILVVESNLRDGDLVDEQIREVKTFHFESVRERNLAGGLHRLATEPFDLVLLSLKLADSQGTATFARVQQACGTVPIVVLTNVDEQNVGLEAISLGAQDYLIKSEINSHVLVRAMRYAIERKLLTGVLHASEVEYRRLFESAKDGILILDAKTGQIKDANQFLIDLLGYSKDEFLTKKLWEVGLFLDIDACKEGFARLQRDDHVRYEDLPIVAKNGRSVDVEFVSNVYRVADQQRIQCNIRDITDRVRSDAVLREQQVQIRQLNVELEQRVTDRTAELETANKELEAFAYSVSHDLRAPLRAIDGFVHLFKGTIGNLAEKPRHYLQMVTDNARQMSRLIDDLLRFSRASRQSVQLQSIATTALVRQCVDELKPQCDGRKVEIQVNALPDCWGDGNLLKQVWLNLIGNALKYTSKRESARIEIGSQTEGDQTVYFVRDNGVGFDMQYAGKLFGVFQRLHAADEFEGTGIGLALVQRILRRHGGRAWADGKVDGGATFSFTLGKRTSHA